MSVIQTHPLGGPLTTAVPKANLGLQVPSAATAVAVRFTAAAFTLCRLESGADYRDLILTLMYGNRRG